jgi:hypothetical protein
MATNLLDMCCFQHIYKVVREIEAWNALSFVREYFDTTIEPFWSRMTHADGPQRRTAREAAAAVSLSQIRYQNELIAAGGMKKTRESRQLSPARWK